MPSKKIPKISSCYYVVGVEFIILKRNMTMRRSAFKSVIQMDPTHFNAWYSLGYTYELMGKKEDAEQSYEKYRRLKGKLDSIMNKEKP